MPTDDSIFNDSERDELASHQQEEPAWKSFFRNNKKIIFGAIGLLVVLTAAVIWLIASRNGDETIIESNNVLIQIQGPDQITSGNEGEYRIIYTNGEDSDLTNVTMEVFYPTGFKYRSALPSASNSQGSRFTLPILKKGETGEVRVKGQVAGSTGEIKQYKAKLYYRLANFNSEFSVEASQTTLILPPNLSVEITGPIEVIGGQDMTFTVSFANVSGQTYENLALIVNYPAGYKFSLSVPTPSKSNNYWSIPKLEMGAAGKIEITGSFPSNAGLDQIVAVELGQINGGSFASLINSSTVFKVAASSLSLAFSSNPKDRVILGQEVEYTLEYANYGTIGMTNIVITATLEGSALDMTRLSVENAIVTGNTLTWKSATLSNLSLLAPNQKGKITFRVPVKSALNTNIKNQTVKAAASIYSAEIPKPIRVPDLEIKLQSELGLAVSGEYVRGSLPMTVGQSTTLAMTFVLTNQSNDLEGVEVVASLPLPSSAWKNVVVPEQEKNRIFFDPNSGKIRWKIGKIAAFVGKYTPAITVSFELEVIPTDSDRNKAVDLLKNVQASGTDTFTGQEISSFNIKDVDTGSIEDDQLNLRGTTVQ